MTLSEHLDLIVARLQALKDDPRYADIMLSHGIMDADQLENLRHLVVDASYVLDDLFDGFARMAALGNFKHEVSDRILRNLAWVIGSEGDH